MKKLGQKWLDAVEPVEDPFKFVPGVTEIPRHSCCKYRLDKRSGRLLLGRALDHGIKFPTNYGFVPHTRSADDEEMDLLLMSEEPLLPLTIARARIVGAYDETTEGEGTETKLLAVAIDDPTVEGWHELADVPEERRTEIESFVTHYKANQGIKVTFDRWLERTTALKRLQKAYKRY